MGKQSTTEEINKMADIITKEIAPLIKQKPIKYKKTPIEYSLVITYDVTKEDNPFYRKLLEFIMTNYLWQEITKSTYSLLTKTKKRFSEEELELFIQHIQLLFDSEKPLNEGFKNQVTKVVLLRGYENRYIQTRTILHEINAKPETIEQFWKAMKLD